MCRWLASTGNPVLQGDAFFKPNNSLVDQGLSSKSAETATNGLGFGAGWLGDLPGNSSVFRGRRSNDR